jgi:hypothetical protein
MDAALRQLVRQRAGGRCEYCHFPQDLSELQFHVEHILPRQHGGTDDPGNLALACPECNLLKGPNLTAIEPISGTVVRLFHPRRDIWLDHFEFKGGTILGKTPTGRATVSLLRMNSPERCRVRLILKDRGQSQ